MSVYAHIACTRKYADMRKYDMCLIVFVTDVRVYVCRI